MDQREPRLTVVNTVTSLFYHILNDSFVLFVDINCITMLVREHQVHPLNLTFAFNPALNRCFHWRESTHARHSAIQTLF